MDPVTLIVSALAAGASQALKGVASDSIKSAYAGLKALVQNRLAGKPEAEIAFAQHEQYPQVWEQPLKDAVAKSGADKDLQIVDAARKLLEELDPQGANSGKYRVEFKGTVQGAIIGDQATQTNTFGTPPR